MGELNPLKLTWAALLGRWIEFAQSALALPADENGRAWKAAVPDIIGLQAICMALGELEELDADERALGVDRSRVLFERHEANLRGLFGARPHAMIDELIRDCREAIEKAATGPIG